MLTPREPALPEGAAPYRHLGPFDVDTIPKGLWREHNLKDGVWAVLSVEEGRIRFCWDDAEGGVLLLTQGQHLLVPPIVPHHLEADGPVIVRLSFWAIPP